MADTPLPTQLRNRDRKRLQSYTENLAFYDGKQWTTAARRGERRLTLNYVRSIIHKTTSYLLTGRTTVAAPLDDTETAAEEAQRTEVALAQVADQNNLEQLDFDTELDAATLGDGVFKVFWDTVEQRVHITAPDPSNIHAWHWPDDPSRLWRVANTYTLDANDTQHIIPSIATTKKRVTITEAWTLTTYQLWADDTLIDETTNPYDFIPFVIFPNLREPKQLWGTSDVPALIDPQRELNRALTQLSKILELSGNPIAVLENVTEAQDIAVTPGAIWEVPEKAKAYLLDLLQHGGVRLHIDYVDAIYRTLHDLSETPRSAFGGIDRDLSGVALQLELDPIVKKVQRKRLIRTAAYRARNEIILLLLNQFTNAGLTTANHDIQWGSVLPTDYDRQVANEVALVGAGVHARRFAADQLGGVDNPDDEFARWLEEEQQARNAGAGPP